MIDQDVSKKSGVPMGFPLASHAPQAAEWVSELCSELPDPHGLPDFLLSDSG